MSLAGLPRPTVVLSGTDGNVYAILGKTMRSLRRAGWTQGQLDEFKAEATGGDYDNVLQTCMKYAEVE